MTDAILEAVQALGLDSRASLNDINRQYRELLFKWHPDKCKDKDEECRQMTVKIMTAYKTLMSYCYNYKFSFLKEDLDNTSTPDDPEEFWNKKFGHDPLWGYTK